MGFADPDMISYLMLVVSLLVVSPVLLHNTQYQVQLEKKFNQTLAENGIESIDEVIQRALFQYIWIEAISVQFSIIIKRFLIKDAKT